MINVTYHNIIGKLDMIKQYSHNDNPAWKETILENMKILEIKRDKLKSKYDTLKKDYLDTLAEYKKLSKILEGLSSQNLNLADMISVTNKEILFTKKHDLEKLKNIINDTLIEYSYCNIQIEHNKYKLEINKIATNTLDELKQIDTTYKDYVEKDKKIEKRIKDQEAFDKSFNKLMDEFNNFIDIFKNLEHDEDSTEKLINSISAFEKIINNYKTNI